MSIKRVCHLCVLALLAPLLAACSDLWLTQPEGTALIKLGNHPRNPVPATDVAGYYAPYALLSLAAYVDANYVEDSERPSIRADETAPRRRLLNNDALIADIEEHFIDPAKREKIIRRAKAHLAQWAVQESYYRGPLGVTGTSKPKPDFECIVGEGKPGDGTDRLSFVKKRTQEECDRLQVLDGLGIVVFYRPRAPCDELVISFRGTDFAQADDWTSNFRAVTRVLPFYDQYEQVQDHIHGIVEHAQNDLCRGQKFKQITAVGHSLGGGLAQQAAYARAGIKRVYAFDSSMVTGYYDAHIAATLKDNKKQLKIDRVFEHGEILAYLRLVARHIVPPSNCEPLTRSARFNEVKGYNPFEQHKMALLTGNLLDLAGDRIPQRRQPEPNLPAPAEANPETGECLRAAR